MVSINELPAEILMNTLRYLEPRQLIRCRRVCSRWRDVVDSLADEQFWQRLCERHYRTIYKEARLKCNPDMTWHELHKSLCLWSKLEELEENWMQLCEYPEKFYKKVCGVSAIQGSMCVHEDKKILYYDSTGAVTSEFDTEWEPHNFRETGSVIVFNTEYNVISGRKLIIIKKTNGKLDLYRKVVIDNVHRYIMVGEHVYYCTQTCDVNIRLKIFECRADNNYESNFITEKVGGYTLVFNPANNTPNIIAVNRDIFELQGNQLVFIDNLMTKTKLYINKTYNIWDSYIWFRKVDTNDDFDFEIGAIYFYENLTFIGGSDGILRLYNTEKILACPRTKPIRQFDVPRRLRPRSMYFVGITGIDVIEKENGHVVLISMYMHAFAIELNHSLNRQSAGINKRKLNLLTLVNRKKREESL